MYSLEFRLPGGHDLARGLGLGESVFREPAAISTSIFTAQAGKQSVSRHWEAVLDTEAGTFDIVEVNSPHLSWGRVMDKIGLSTLFGAQASAPVAPRKTVREGVYFELAIEMLKSLEAQSGGGNLAVERDAISIATHWRLAESLLLDDETVVTVTPAYKKPQPAEPQPGPASP